MTGRNTKGEVRRSQLISTYGVGAIVAVQDESFMVAGIDRWDVQQPDLQEPRLEQHLGVLGFAEPPSSESGDDIPVVRFPDWYWCPACRRLDQHRFFTTRAGTKCGACDVELVPSRFVMACPKGHIDDFPYFRWVHAGSRPAGEQSHRLTIQSAGATASLRDIQIECSCGKAMTLDGAFGRGALRRVTQCTGRRPWLTVDDDSCEEVPRTLQRGASNVWFSITESALSIPPWSEGAFKILSRHWQMLRHAPDEALRAMIAGAGIATESYSVDDLVDAARGRRDVDETATETTRLALRRQEYEALVRGQKETGRKQDFVSVPGTLGPEGTKVLERVMLAKRLREVRALVSFTRMLPPSPGGDADRRAPLYDEPPGWLPAIQVIGEGVFLELSDDRLSEWERLPAVVERTRVLDLHYRAGFVDRGLAPDREVTPRLLLVHTMAHSFINQWALDSGYPAGSLRERLYVADDMAGFLLYTGTTDSAGSLGGVVAQAAPGRLDDAIREATVRSQWCSSDPVCIESDASGVDALNLAACHACLLLPEVSCEERNVLLDRALLVGTPENPELGFLTGRS